MTIKLNPIFNQGGKSQYIKIDIKNKYYDISRYAFMHNNKIMMKIVESIYDLKNEKYPIFYICELYVPCASCNTFA